MNIQTNAFIRWMGAFLFAGIPFIHILMKYVACSIGLVAAIMPAMPALSARASDAPRVLLSEINWAGSPRSTADEWFELANISNEPVDVGGWVISGVATSGQAISLAEGTIIAAHGTLLVANYDVSENSTLTVHPDLITTAVSIPNRSLSVLLVMPDGTVIDSYLDTGNPDFGDAVTFSSMERNLTDLTWNTAAGSTNLEGHFGTPGAIWENVVDAIEPEPVEGPVVEPEPVVEPLPQPIVEEVAVPVVEEDQEIVPEPTIEPVVETPVEEPVYEPVPAPVVEPSVEPAPEVVPEPEPTTPVVVIPPPQEPSIAVTGAVILHEIVSDPDVGNEWIEIRNVDEEPIDLTGWYVVDASGKATNVGEIALEPQTLYIIESPLGKLNNDGDTVTLFDRYGVQKSSMQYGKSTKGESWAWDGTAWRATPLITKGAENRFPVAMIQETLVEESEGDSDISYAEPVAEPAVPADAPDSEPAPKNDVPAAPPRVTVVAAATPRIASTSTVKPTPRKTSSSSKTVVVRTITSLDDVTEGERVRYTGTLIALPGTYGSQLAVLDGAMLYLHKADWPALQLNDVVQVEGEVSISKGEKRIKLTSDNITVTGRADVMSLSFDQARAASLVSVEGTVISREGDTLALDINGKVLMVRAADATGVSWSHLASAKVAITGVYRLINGAPVLMPRTPDDVVLLPDAVLSQPSTAAASPTSARPWVGAGLLTSSAGALGYWFVRSRSLIPA